MTELAPLLEVRNLHTYFDTPGGTVRAVDDVSFSLGRREALGIVGESGSGKSVTALTILRLFGPLTKVAVSGEVLFEGRDLLKLSQSEMRKVRGGQIAMIFQDPLTSLNPSMPIGEQVAETVRLHRGLSKAKARGRALELLELVGISDPHRRLDDLPYSFSGGMRQRIMIAIAIACEPKLLIADEATTALDVTIQAQVLLLLDRLRRELGMALILITHDFGVVASTCDRIQVMYGGRLVERGFVQDVLERASHPYTSALIRLIPRLDAARTAQLHPIRGQPAVIIGSVRGCRFAPRCEYAQDVCLRNDPPTVEVGIDHVSACWFALERPGSNSQPKTVSAGVEG